MRLPFVVPLAVATVLLAALVAVVVYDNRRQSQLRHEPAMVGSLRIRIKWDAQSNTRECVIHDRLLSSHEPTGDAGMGLYLRGS